MKTDTRRSIAVIGGGVAGLTAAWLLAKKHDVTLFEKNSYVGGHTNTIVIEGGEDAGTAVDTGFIVCNDRTYPNFHRLLAELGARVRDADMSFGYADEVAGLQYAGTDLNGLFAQRSNLLSPSFLSMLLNIFKFQKKSRAALRAGLNPSLSLGDFLWHSAISRACIDHYVVPMGAAIWSAPQQTIFDFPALSFLQFFENHGLLDISDMPQWQTVIGGSFDYVKRFREKFQGRILSSTDIRQLKRLDQGVELSMDGHGTMRFDRAVVATHADEALKLLADPSADEQRLLSAWRYQKNHTVLHTDASLLPSNRRAWASWNYVKEAGADGHSDVTLTYHMNRLQGLKTKNEYCVTLNQNRRIDPAKVIKSIDYMHPIFDPAAVATQAELPKLNGQRHTWFCGSYFANGFHEDAVKSSVAVAADFGIHWS